MVELGKPCEFCKTKNARLTTAELNNVALCSLCFEKRLSSMLGKRKK